MVIVYVLDPHTHGLSKSLAQCFCLAHLQGEDLTASHGSEGRVGAQSLGDT